MSALFDLPSIAGKVHKVHPSKVAELMVASMVEHWFPKPEISGPNPCSRLLLQLLLIQLRVARRHKL